MSAGNWSRGPRSQRAGSGPSPRLGRTSRKGRLCWADPTRLGGSKLCRRNSASSPFEPFVSVLGFMLHDGHPSGCLPMSAALSAHGRLGGG